MSIAKVTNLLNQRNQLFLFPPPLNSVLLIMTSYLAVLSDDQRKQLLNYEYAGSDASILLRVYRPFLEWLVERVPLLMSPNLITLAGFVCVNTAAMISITYSSGFVTDVPEWVFLFNAIAIWLYQLLDNLDGKQARRTQSSSAFGELFDHGVDAYAATSASICFMSVLQIQVTSNTVLVPFLIYFPFYFATWEQFHTGRMDLGIVNGAMEGLFSLVLLNLILYCDPTIATVWIAGYPIAVVLTAMGTVLCTGCVLCNCFVIFKKSGPTAIKEIMPLLTLFFCTLICAYGDQSVDIGLIFLGGLVFGHIGTILTLNHLSRTPFPAFHIVLVPHCLLALNQILILSESSPVISQSVLVWFSIIVVLVHTIVYKAILITDITSALSINFLTLTERQKSNLLGSDSTERSTSPV